MSEPRALMIIDIDGLRRDVFEAALQSGSLPSFERILGGPTGEAAFQVPAVSTAPSITFTAQASIVTGTHPGVHGIIGNESFDRFGRISDGRPRHFGFDVGDTLAADDAVNVFRQGLASRALRSRAPTLYEKFALRRLPSAVFYHMYARGASFWRPPNLIDIARFTKGRGVLGLEAGQYDAGMLRNLGAYLHTAERPSVVMAYFMGLDHHSHLHGPDTQAEYLAGTLDAQMGQLLTVLEQQGWLDDTLFAIVSDHGQINAIPDDRHSLRLGFPFDLELVHVFSALGLDVHDKPGEDPGCDAVMGLNGGLAHVHLQRHDGRWADPPYFEADVLRVAQAFHDMNTRGRYAPELQETLELVLVRNVEAHGWDADYEVVLESGQRWPLSAYLEAHPELAYIDAANRLSLMISEAAGDLLLIARGRDGYYFGGPQRGVHGGLLAGESEPVLVLAYPGGNGESITHLHQTFERALRERCAAEGGRQPSVADMVPLVESLLGWCEERPHA